MVRERHGVALFLSSRAAGVSGVTRLLPLIAAHCSRNLLEFCYGVSELLDLRQACELLIGPDQRSQPLHTTVAASTFQCLNNLHGHAFCIMQNWQSHSNAIRLQCNRKQCCWRASLHLLELQLCSSSSKILRRGGEIQHATIVQA